jgi:hypothetical protein
VPDERNTSVELFKDGFMTNTFYYVELESKIFFNIDGDDKPLVNSIAGMFESF